MIVIVPMMFNYHSFSSFSTSAKGENLKFTKNIRQKNYSAFFYLVLFYNLK